MRLAVLLLLLICGACSTHPKTASGADYRVELTPAQAGAWTVTFDFRTPAPAWLLTRTHPDLDGAAWRRTAWNVETPGVRLVQRAGYDILTGDGAPLNKVRIRMTAHPVPLRADYVSVLRFSDGGVAHFTGHYDALPLQSLAAADALPGDLSGESGAPSARGVFSVVAPGARMLHRGRTFNGRTRTTLDEPGYIYVGEAPLIETPALAAVVDPGMPAWMRKELDTFTPRLLALHRSRLGEPAGARPTVFAAWGGAERKGLSLSGSVLEGLVVMELSGAGVSEPTPAARTRIRWLLGHETAHFWLGQTVQYARREESWMLEGGADLLAVRALQALDPAYDPMPELQKAVDECPRLLKPGQSLNQASASGAPRAAYACGAVLLLAAEAALRRKEGAPDASVFWRRLIAEHRSDGEMGQADWLAAFGKAVDDPGLTEETRRFVQDGAPDASAFLRRLFERSGVPHRLDGEKIILSGRPL